MSASLLTPEQALSKTRNFLTNWGDKAVIGIAGPGEPLANHETLDTLNLIRGEFPHVTLCLCTNGIDLPDTILELVRLGVKHLSLTVNSFDEAVVARIQPRVVKNDQVYIGRKAAEVLLENQIAGIKAAVDSGMFLKTNCVVVPGINDTTVLKTAERVKILSAYF